LERTGGKLAWRDRMVLLAQGVKAIAASKFQGRVKNKLLHTDLDLILPPDSAICVAAESLAQEVSEPYLFNHCMRAYFWARLLNNGKSFDDEAVYTALLLHDLGLTDTYRLKGDAQHCFTIPAAREANKLALQHGWSDRRAGLVADAIALHLNVSVDDQHGREAQLVRIGSGADVAGLGMEFISQELREGVIARYPRLDMKRNIHAALRIESKERPHCRMAFLCNSLSFHKRIESALFKE
jgi:HD domain